MSKPGGTSISLDNMSRGPPNLDQEDHCKEAIDNKKTVFSIDDGFKKPRYSLIESIYVDSSDAPGEGYCGMEMDLSHFSRRSTFVKKLDLEDVNADSGFVQLTSHPNLLNLMDVSISKNEIYINYERPGISLSKLQQYDIIDRITVATICKKVSKYSLYSSIND